MMFCPDCGSILVHKTRNKIRYECCKCGFYRKLVGERKLTDTPRVKSVEVLDGVNRVAVHDHKCAKCGYGKAEIIDKGPMYSDEDDVVLFRCGKCGHTEMMDAKIQ